MIYYDKINENQKSVIYPNLGTFLKRINFQSYLHNRCHDLEMMSINLSDIAVLNIKGTDYHCIISEINKSGAINPRQNFDLTEKRGTLKKKNLSSYIKRLKKF